jgi:hypothetical protein
MRIFPCGVERELFERMRSDAAIGTHTCQQAPGGEVAHAQAALHLDHVGDRKPPPDREDQPRVTHERVLGP